MTDEKILEIARASLSPDEREDFDRGRGSRQIEQLRAFAENVVRELYQWLPIETAPKDKRILVRSGQEVYAAHWAKNITTDDEAWIVAEWGTEGDQALVKPTHWMSLPETPNAVGNSAGTALSCQSGVAQRSES